MLRIPAVIAVLGLSVLTLAACSSGPASSASCERPESDAAVLDLVDVTGDPGAPEVTLNAPVYVDDATISDEVVGDGLAVTSEMQDVVFSVAIANGSTGETLLTSGTQVQPVSGWMTDYDGLAQMMMCATEGSRIVAALPASDFSDAAVQNFGITDDQSVVVAMDLQKVYLGAADGESQYNDRRGMPSVVLAPDGQPGIIIPDVDPPADLAVEVLKKGSGPAVTAEDSIRIHYTGVTWADREVFDSTWDKGASAAVTLDGVVPGFAQALDGQTVGSQLLVVIPPELAYGDQGSGSVPADATLVFVIDILGIDAPTTATQ